MANLTVLVTNKCNLHCDFCSNADIMEDDSKVSKELDILLEQYLYQSPIKYDRFQISGGEPTIDKTQLENILSAILSYNESADIQIYTNGSYLSLEMVETFNQFPNIRTNISIDGVLTRERGLFKLLDKDFRMGYENLLYINMLNNKTIRAVVNRDMFNDFGYALELAMLYNQFKCPVIIDFDYRSEHLNKIDLNDVYNIGEFIYRLSVLGVYGNNKVTFNKFFTQPCSADCGDIFKWDGSIISGCHMYSESGCNSLRNKLKPGMYDLLSQFILYNTFDYKTTLEDKPNYNDTLGYVGDRVEHTPIRKQLQYNERVNFKYRNENQILITEVK